MQCKKMILDIQGREMILKSELNTYTEKYEVFQDSLKKSNDIFVTYKLEIEKVFIISLIPNIHSYSVIIILEE